MARAHAAQRVMWLGFGVNAVSGLLLLLVHPAKALTNWVFFVKLLLIAIAVLLLGIMRENAFAAAGAAPQPVSVHTRRLAMLSLGCWASAILAGRLLAGTVGLFDLRLLGLGKGVAPATLHRGLLWGVVGFGIPS